MNAGPHQRGQALSWETETDGLCRLTLHREPLNEIGEVSLAELEAFVAVLDDPAIRGVLIVSGLERGFSAGADLRALHAAIVERGQAAVVEEARDFVERIGAALTALDTSPKPIVAAVHGVVFGGGLELALVCDIIIADRTARFAFPELRLGLIPGFGGLVRLQRDLPNGLVRDLLLTGRSLNADRAREAGLVSQVVGEGKHAKIAASTLRQTLKLPAAAIAAAKRHAKPSDRAALAAERATFLELLAQPEAAAGLATFAASAETLPYLPRQHQ